jgi:hypothetical protein
VKFMILVKGNQDSEAGKMPPESLIAEMGAYHEELAKAGVLVDGSGLKPTKHGWRKIVGGYTIIDVKSREEAIAWTKRFPNPSIDGAEAEIEVREYFALEDFGESPAIDKFRKIGIGE